MRNNGRGGMQTSAAAYALYCPKCGKPAARMEQTASGKRYLHFTKKGSIWHEQSGPQAGKGEQGNVSRKD